MNPELAEPGPVPAPIVDGANGEEATRAMPLSDAGFTSLEGVLGGPMEVGAFLRIAIAIASALGKVHQDRIVHKDIKPANILVNPDNGQVRFTGFGLSSRMARERSQPRPPESIAGTLAYMAPEQTGRMNRSVDSRSDLYALGVTLYQMVTGSLPFIATDPMEWVHCHIARKPVPPSERLENVPASVSAVIMKLLVKTPEDRYQTAGGVGHDLRRCLAAWEAEHQIDDFPLGEHDMPDRLLVPEKLYGRSREIETLLAAFDRMATGRKPELVLVSGHPGIGKSSLVNELHKVLVPPRGLFASGKFDQYKRDIPYATLAQAFRELIQSLLGKNEAELARWRDALREALNPNGQLMVDLVPELELIIGEQPPVPELSPQEEKGRFLLVFQRFIGVFARPEHPLALFLDDLQWLDAATLDLLEDLLTRSELRHLMLIGAYRDNEVAAAHPLARRLEAIRDAQVTVKEISLAPLAREDVGKLVADALRCEPARADPLTELVREKTGGNPFFMIQFLCTLPDEGLLAFDYQAARWSWDLGRIREKGYTANVVDLMVGKLNRLPAVTQQGLQQLACLGNGADLATLALVRGTSEEEVHADLSEAVRLELVERLDGAYRFVHDRVQEAAYSLIPEPSRAVAHLRIGRVLAAHTAPEKREEVIFEIVNQLNRGVALITSQNEREQLAEFNLIAGKRAKNATAYASALTYLTAGRRLLPEDSWERYSALTFAFDIHRAECEFLTGDLAAAEERLSIVSVRAANPVDKAAVACLRTSLYTTLGRPDRAVEICVEYLREAGIACSPHPTKDEVQQEYERMWLQIGNRSIEELVDLPLMTSPEGRATMDVLTAVLAPAAHTDDDLLFLVVCRMANLSLEDGNSDGSCFAYVWLGTLIGIRFGNYRVGFSFGKLGVDLMEQRGLRRFEARVYLLFAIISDWMQPVRTGLGLVRRAFDAANRLGDIAFAGFSYAALIPCLLATGEPLADVQREAEAGLDFARRFRFGVVLDLISSNLRLIQTLRGLTPEFGSFDDTEFDEGRFEQELAEDPRLSLVAFLYWLRKLQARFFASAYVSAAAAAANAHRVWPMTPAVLQQADYQLYAALARAALCDVASAADRTQHHEALAAHHRQLQEWAENCPENFEDRATLVAAEIARIEGRDAEAMRLYERAIAAARANGFVHNQALASELAARFYSARGIERIAQFYLREARNGYLRWGADGKVRQLDQLHPPLGTDEPVPDARRTIEVLTEHLDLATVLRVSQAVSGEIVLEKLIDTLLRTAIEHAGAARGLLVLSRGDELSVAAEASTVGDTVTVRLRDGPVAGSELPESVVQYAARTRESVMLDDASVGPFSDDAYIRERHARSVFCLPLVKQDRLVALLYLENSLAPHVFTPARTAVLKVLASQAAISLENSRLYRELGERERQFLRMFNANTIAIFTWEVEGGRILDANDAFLQIIGYEREDLRQGRLRWTDLTPPEILKYELEVLSPQYKLKGRLAPLEKEYFHKDGHRVPVLIGVSPFDDEFSRGMAFIADLTEQKRAEALLAGEKRILEMVTRGDSLPRILESLCELVEQQAEGVLASVLLAQNGRLVHGAAPSLPKAYVDAIDGGAIGPSAGSCGTAAHRGEQVIVSDIATDPLWADYREAALSFSLRACWSTPIFSSEGNVIGTFAMYYREARRPSAFEQEIIEQITHLAGVAIQHKVGEEELRESEAYLAEAQKLSQTGSWAWCPDGDIRYWSDECYRVLSFDPQDGLPRFEEFFQRIHPDDQPRSKELVETAAREKAPFEGDYRIVHPDGPVRDIHVVGRPVLSASGHLVEFVGTVIDITDRRRREQRLLAQFHVTQTLSEASSLEQAAPGFLREMCEALKWDLGAFWQVDPEGGVLRCIATWSRGSAALPKFAAATRAITFGPGNGLPGRVWSSGGPVWIRDVALDPELPRAKSAAKEGLHAAFAFPVRLKSGIVGVIELFTREVRDADPELLQMMAAIGSQVAQFIERIRTNDALGDTREKLAQASKIASLAELSASIAHEINQPLQAIVANGYAGLRWLDARPPNIEKAIRTAQRVVRDGNAAAEVVSRIRALFKHAAPEKTDLEINKLIMQVRTLMADEIQGNGVSLEIELGEDLPRIMADAVQIQQVLINLIRNGIEAMAEAQRKGLLVRSRRSAGHVVVDVSDQGTGLVNPEKIFEPFVSTKKTGMGMGLTICRSIIEAHAGDIRVVHNEGPGVTFSFSLPVEAPDAT